MSQTHNIEQKQEVLIVGAGPTGLILALQLQRYSVPFRIIEKNKTPLSGSKGLSLNPLTLRILNDFGVLEELLEIGHKTEVLNIHFKNTRLSRIDFQKMGQNNSCFIMLPQPDTERVLRQALYRNGGVIESGTELTDIRQIGSDVEVNLINHARQKETKSFPYVVSCEGGRSTIRSSLGIEFEGYDYDMHFLLADVKVNWNGKINEGHYFIQENDFCILLPLTDGYHRVVAKVDGRFDKNNPPTLSKIKTIFGRCKIPDLQLHDPIWLSQAPFYNRLATVFRDRRVFLAGDAAHLFSPLGGYGMNTGIGDSFNLGWRFGMHLNHHCSETLLDDYSRERRHIAKTLIAQTDKSTSLISRLDRHEKEEELTWLPLMQNRKRVKNSMYAATGLALHYRDDLVMAPEVVVKSAEIGMMFPHSGLLDILLKAKLIGNCKYTLLFYNKQGDNIEDLVVKSMEAVDLKYVDNISTVVISDSKPKYQVSAQIHSSVDNRMEYIFSESQLFLIRPDFYIDLLSTSSECHVIFERISKLFDAETTNVNNVMPLPVYN